MCFFFIYSREALLRDSGQVIASTKITIIIMRLLKECWFDLNPYLQAFFLHSAEYEYYRDERVNWVKYNMKRLTNKVNMYIYVWG